MLVVEVDVVGPEALERTFDCDADALRTAVRDTGFSTRVRDDAELRRHHHLIPPPLDGLTHQLLAVERAIDLGGVDMGDAQFERPVDGANRLVVVEPSTRRIDAGHGHRAETDAGDVESPQRDVLHWWLQTRR